MSFPPSFPNAFDAHELARSITFVSTRSTLLLISTPESTLHVTCLVQPECDAGLDLGAAVLGALSAFEGVRLEFFTGEI